MNEKITPEPVEGFSTVQIKCELQERFQQKTAGMSFEELRSYPDQSLTPLPQENRRLDPSVTDMKILNIDDTLNSAIQSNPFLKK